MPIALSVIICTHNPREDYLRRVLEALDQQTLPKDQWELLLIDNASQESVAGLWDLSWHPLARHIREDTLGLTPARLRGIRESVGALLVFVDDDNILDQDYLSGALGIADTHPWVGAFNGVIAGEFEVSPPAHIECCLPTLAIREFESARWSCRPGLGSLDDAPCGAGLVIRKQIADHYEIRASKDTLRSGLDRRGSGLISCGDSDLALCSCELGLAVGMFPEIKMRHLIPARRIQEEYLIELAQGLSTSFHILKYLWEGAMPKINPAPALCRSERILRAYKQFRSRKHELTFKERIEISREKGRLAAVEMLEKSQRS